MRPETKTPMNHTETKPHTFNGMTDTVTENLKNGFEAQRKMTEAFFKPFTGANAEMPTVAAIISRQIAMVTGMVELHNRFAVEATKMVTDHAAAMTKAWETTARGMLATMGVEKADMARMPETAKAFVTEAMDTTARTSDRIVRLGMTHAEHTARLVNETVLARHGN